jgi:hypothetical protein
MKVYISFNNLINQNNKNELYINKNITKFFFNELTKIYKSKYKIK